MAASQGHNGADGCQERTVYSLGTVHYISPLLPVREVALPAMFFLAEMICLSGCLMNCFDSSNCLALLVGAAVWCRVLSEPQKGVKRSGRIFLGAGSGEPLGPALIPTSDMLSPAWWGSAFLQGQENCSQPRRALLGFSRLACPQRSPRGLFLHSFRPELSPSFSH